MPDNIVLNAGSGGETLATDQAAGGQQYQLIKLVDGTANSTTPIPLVGTLGNGLLVNVSQVQGNVAVTNAGLTELEAAINANRLDVNLAAQVANIDVNLAASGITVPISAVSLPLPTGAATAAGQLPDGHNVTVDNAGGASAVNIQDGGNSITIDGGLTEPLPAGTNNIGDVDIASALPSGNNNIGNVDIASALPAGTNNIGDVDVASIAAGANLVGDVGISGARTSGGTTLYKNIDVDESEDQVKGTAGQIYWIHAINVGAAPRYLKIYNATAANVTVGTSVPDLTFPIPTQGDANGAGFTLSIPNGIEFDTAITIAATTGVADNDSGAPGANEVIVNLGYA